MIKYNTLNDEHRLVHTCPGLCEVSMLQGSSLRSSLILTAYQLRSDYFFISPNVTGGGLMF